MSLFQILSSFIMSSSSTNRNKISKDKVSTIKLAKSNQLSNDMQSFKISLSEVIKDYDPKMKVVYQDALPSKTRLPKDDERVHCPVIIVVLESVQRQLVKALLWKHYPLNGDAFRIFLSFSEKFLNINTLKLEDTHLQKSDIVILAQFLKANPIITELNLTGNKYNENFKLLIQDTKLKYLTLKFCGINSRNLGEFIQPLNNAYKQPLLHLNLSNNHFGDEGARILADVLRINRILISLNITANDITDVGAREILRSLQTFCLNQDEISIRRKIYYQYYLKKYEEITAKAPSPSIDEEKFVASRASSVSATRIRSKAKSTKSRSRKSSKSAISLNEIFGRPYGATREISSAPASSPSVILPHAEPSDLISILDFQSAYHPFVKETNLDGYQFYCRGNFVLAYINFSFNQLTTEILKEIQEVLKYQISCGSTEEGLKSVSTFGNNMKSEDTENLQKDLGDMFQTKSSRTGSSTSSRDISKKTRRLSK